MTGVLPSVTLYTDGSCSPNPGPGGWAVVVCRDGQDVETLAGSEPETTNNRMELTAALRGLQHLAEPRMVEIHTDSRYLKDGIGEWLPGWQRRGWTTITGEEVRNRDLWLELAREIARHQVAWHWLKGHGDNRFNILADQLAGQARQRPQLPLFDERAVHIFLAITWRQQRGGGAWAGVMQYRRHLRVLGEARWRGSGNALHLVSAIESLGRLRRALPVHVYTTSGYLREGASSWLDQWRSRDWQTRDGLEVSNRELWQELAVLLDRLPVTFHLIDKAEPPCHLAAAKILAGEWFAEADPALPE